MLMSSKCGAGLGGLILSMSEIGGDLHPEPSTAIM